MSSVNWQLETRSAIWASLHADADWTAATAKGTEYTFSTTELLKRFAVEAVLCPIVAIGPASAELPPISRKTLAGDADSYRIRVELAEKDVDAVEQLVTLFHAAMTSQWARLAAVRDYRLYEITVAVEYEPLPAKDSPQPLWLAALTLVCRYRAA